MSAPTSKDVRRRWLLALVVSPLWSWPLFLRAQPTKQRIRPKSPPVWTGLGFNGSTNQERYRLTRDFVKTQNRKPSDSDFAFMREPLRTLLAPLQPPLVQFKQQIEFGEDLLVGFAHDFEATVGIRIEQDGVNANTLIIFMAGVGIILDYDKSRGWRIISSFPFMLHFERRGGDLKKVHAEAVGYLGEAYKSYAGVFVKFLARFNKWNQGFSASYFAKLTKASIHADAQTVLAKNQINELLNSELLGFSCSSLICDKLDIPLQPYRESQATSGYAVKFSDDLTAQQGPLEMPPAYLQFEVVLRDLEKVITHSTQKRVTIIRRTLVIRLLASNMDERFLNVVAASTEEDRIPLYSTEDDTPDRDLVFFERLLSKTFGNLLSGLVDGDAQKLSSVGVKLDSVSKEAIPKLLRYCNLTRN